MSARPDDVADTDERMSLLRSVALDVARLRARILRLQHALEMISEHCPGTCGCGRLARWAINQEAER